MLPSSKQNYRGPLEASVRVDGEALSKDIGTLEKQIRDLQARVARVKKNTFKFKDMVREDENLEDIEDVNESARQPEDVVTVEDFIELLSRITKPDDRIMFRVHKKNGMLFAVNSRGGTAVVDIVPAVDEDEDTRR